MEPGVSVHVASSLSTIAPGAEGSCPSGTRTASESISSRLLPAVTPVSPAPEPGRVATVSVRLLVVLWVPSGFTAVV